MKNIIFPKRFEIEGVNPLECKVIIVGTSELNIYDNMEQANQQVNIEKFVGPMADKLEGKWCVRFETKELNKMMCN